MMPKGDREFHRNSAARCFNQTWDYLEMKARTDHDDQMVLQLAHASRYHWGLVGTPRNRAVGDWQISRVYAALKQPQPSLLFAKSSLKTCKTEKLPEVLANAYEAVARAYAVAEDRSSANRHLKLAKDQLGRLDLGAADRKLYLGQIGETEKLLK